MRTVHERLRPSSCPEVTCDYKAAANTTLRQHLERHKGVKSYDCSLCDTKFFNKHEQKRHISEVHDKVKQKNCPYCAKTFSRNCHLKTHLKTHNIIS